MCLTGSQVTYGSDWRQWHPTPVLLPGGSCGWRSLVGCSPWGCWESDTTEWLHFHFSLSCIGEGNGNPLQCSCLDNPRDGGAWWAAVYGVAQSRTRLKRLSSSSSSRADITPGLVLSHYYDLTLLGVSNDFLYGLSTLDGDNLNGFCTCVSSGNCLVYRFSVIFFHQMLFLVQQHRILL